MRRATDLQTRLRAATRLIQVGILVATSASFAVEPAPRPDFFPERTRVADRELSLNGIGTRTATLFAIKVYHAAFYADRSVTSLAEALTAPNPKRLEIRYVRDFTLKEVMDAWRYQFRESGGPRVGEVAGEIEKLVSFQSPIREGDVQRFDFEDGKTIFAVNGERRGEVAGPLFQTVLLTIFFGPNPPTRDLQRGLARGVRPPPVPSPTPIAVPSPAL